MGKGKRPKYGWRKPRSPYWWYRFKIDGRLFYGSTGCEDHKAAAAVIEEKRVEARSLLEDERSNLGFVRGGRKQLSLQQALNRFEDDKGQGWKSLRDKKRYAKYLLSIAQGSKTLLSEITEEDLIRYRQSRKKARSARVTEVTDATLNREIAHLQACMNYCGKVLKYEIPLLNWQVCHEKDAERERQWVLSPSEEKKLFAAVAKEMPDLVPLVQFSLWAAMRKAAAINLTWDCVNLEDKVATIYLKGKGRPRPHMIALTDRMIKLLRSLPQVEGCPYVFTYECLQNTRDRKGRMKWKGQRYRFTEAGWTKHWLKALEAAGLKGFRFHDLRHTGATRLTRSTGDIQLTKQQLGHADIKTTLRYSRVTVDDLRAAQEKAQRQVAHLRVVKKCNTPV